MLAGLLPNVSELLDSDGLPHRNPARGIRPFAIAEALLRLAALCAVHRCNNWGPSLAPLQVGVDISGGAEGVGHALRSALYSHPDNLLLSLDCKNAFNSISRQEILRAAQELAPVLLPSLCWPYGSLSREILCGAQHDSSSVLSNSGVKQEDPLGLLLFTLTLIELLHRVATAHLAAQIVAFFDDNNFFGPAAAAAHAFQALSIGVRTASLTHIAFMSAAFGSKQDMAAAVAAELGVLHVRDGLVIAGTPIGTDPFVRDFLFRK
jgi:hypothetical protein